MSDEKEGGGFSSCLRWREIRKISCLRGSFKWYAARLG